MAPRRVNVFTIPPGQPFLTRFVEALHEGAIIDGFPDHDDPLSLASATILVPTQRAAQALRDVLSQRREGSAIVLPRIRTFGQLGSPDDYAPEEDEAGAGLLLPPAVSVTERRLVLMRFIMRWASVEHRTSSSEMARDVGELISAAPAHAWRLAGDLAAIIDEMEIEGVPWDRLASVTPEEFDDYWKLTLGFLRIAPNQWSSYLAATGLIDRVARQRLIIDAQIARLGAETGGPVIAIGSTGTNKATARLLGALARSPRGAVVLPGLDLQLDEMAWKLIAGDSTRRIEPSAGHPQAALHRLLQELQIERTDVVDLGPSEHALAAREDFIAQALRPADATDIWAELRAQRDESALELGLSGLSLVIAEDEREEALALAIAMREVLEDPNHTAVLITPDRGLAMRVRADLARWGVEVDDSAGEPLRLTPLGSLGRLMLDLASSPIKATDLLNVVAHPALRLGLAREEAGRLAQLIEIGLARALLPGCERAQDLAKSARATSQLRDSHLLRKNISDADWDAIEAHLGALDVALAPLRELSDRASLPERVAAHRRALHALTDADDVTARPEAHLISALFEGWSGEAAQNLPLSAYDYTVLFEQALQDEVVRQVRPAHPRLQILGLLEARLIRADRVLLGGLDETIWPPQSQTDAFLNRPMRAQLGLTSPERRIGQTAHDFVQALGHGDVIISRANKRGGAPTVPSRLLQRMDALAGPAWQPVIARGARYLDLARQLDQQRPVPLPRGGERPQPKPPLAERPQRLSVTRIETLRRDPYSIYAESILRLKPLDPVGPEAGIRESGIILHGLLSQFSNGLPAAAMSGDATAMLLNMAREAFSEFLTAPDFAAFNWPRIITQLTEYVRWETARRPDIRQLFLEHKGALKLTLLDGSGFTLTAEADRIEVHRDGTLSVLDFKSGRVPTKKEIGAGFAPQLVLESAMLQKGAFPDVPDLPVRQAVYVKLGGDDGLSSSLVETKEKQLGELVSEQFAGLQLIIEQFRYEDMAYVSRPYPQFVSRYGRYDHLARVKEWSSMVGEA